MGRCPMFFDSPSPPGKGKGLGSGASSSHFRVLTEIIVCLDCGCVTKSIPTYCSVPPNCASA
jgi:hypothetical protein